METGKKQAGDLTVTQLTRLTRAVDGDLLEALTLALADDVPEGDGESLRLALSISRLSERDRAIVAVIIAEMVKRRGEQAP